MTTPEARRLELYAGLNRVLGEREADTLMAYLPSHEAVALATTSDLAGLEARLGLRIDRLEHSVESVEDRMGRLEHRIDLVNQRLDRLFLTMGAGLLAVVATLVAGTFFG
jgi:hypothetical protein